MGAAKLTKQDDRWYDDACPMALALDLLGERWALLVVRELMFGPRRFSALRASLPGLSANVLTQRLAGLERNGIVVRRMLPPPASAQVYALSDWGREIGPVAEALGRWAARGAPPDPARPMSPASLMLSFRTLFMGERLGDRAFTVGFRLGVDGFVAQLDRAGIAIRREAPDGADIVLAGMPGAVAGVVHGGRPLAEAIAAGDLTLTGSRAVAEYFVRLFPWPERVAVA